MTFFIEVIIMINIKDNNLPVPVLMKSAKDFTPLFAALLKQKSIDFNSHLETIINISNKLTEMLLVEQHSEKERRYSESFILGEVVELYCKALEEDKLEDIEKSIINYIGATSRTIVPNPEQVFENFPEDLDMAICRTSIYSQMIEALTYKEFSTEDTSAVFGKKTIDELADKLTDMIFNEGQEIFDNNPDFNILSKKSILKNQLAVIMKSCICVTVRYSMKQTEIIRAVFKKERAHTKESLNYFENYKALTEKKDFPPFIKMIEAEFHNMVEKNYKNVNMAINAVYNKTKEAEQPTLTM